MSRKFTLGALFAVMAWAQPSPFESKPARGAMPFANLVGTEVDSVDTTTGNLNLSMPLATLPPWRGGQSFGVSLIYNSALWDIAPSWIDGPMVGEAPARVVRHELVAGSTGGWKYNFRNIGVEVESRVNDGGQTCFLNNNPIEDALRSYRIRVGLADGSQHVLHLRGHGTEHYGGTSDGYYAFDFTGKRSGCASLGPNATIYPADLSGPMTYFTADGSYLKLEIEAAPNGPLQTWRLYLPDGTRIRGKGRNAEVLDDPNGNNITINDFCNDLECFDVSTYLQTVQTGSGVQTLNTRTRQISVHYNAVPWTYSTTDDIQYRGYQQGATQLLTTTVYWNNYAVNAASNPQRGYLCWYYPTLSNPQSTGACSLAGVYLRQVNRINLPTANGSYFFSYNDSGAANTGYGELRSFNTPYSGTHLYRYLSQNGAPLESYRDITNPVAQRLRAAGVQNSELLTWNYSCNLRNPPRPAPMAPIPFISTIKPAPLIGFADSPGKPNPPPEKPSNACGPATPCLASAPTIPLTIPTSSTSVALTLASQPVPPIRLTGTAIADQPRVMASPAPSMAPVYRFAAKRPLTLCLSLIKRPSRPTTLPLRLRPRQLRPPRRMTLTAIGDLTTSRPRIPFSPVSGPSGVSSPPNARKSPKAAPSVASRNTIMPMSPRVTITAPFLIAIPPTSTDTFTPSASGMLPSILRRRVSLR